ncbi:hypothetical protein ONS95_002655 [Cadophora gregata]|uniref:uncharacterized protein n=1 Tax=Cadophora gregata TaxID=51156 RepID=UPI0026DA916E|nr:uncharacterized protein ONS95_002655 [Cadophora gregata]KAK0109991.1 hypothetical protein ONS95_002655 [Cadophora gregata]KAK0110385.1 hypothetical protein ONS96_002000 [Cadophora gregata f. sp. sojae]
MASTPQSPSHDGFQESGIRLSSCSTPSNDEEKALPAAEVDRSKERDTNLVGWDGDHDPENPLNWSDGYKWWITFQLSMLAMAASLGSSIIAPAEAAIAEYAGVSKEVTVLVISLYIIGFAFGPLCWAPVSELWGRRMSLLPAMACLGLFSIGTAVGKNAETIFVTRFFAGLFGSAPVSNVAAALGDIWEPKSRGIAITFYAVAVVGGPTLGPTIGAALLVNPHLGWRWTEYIQAIWTFAATVLAFFALPEIYSPVILKKKAQRLRKETGNRSLHHPHEDIKLSPKTIVTKHLGRPLRMLLTEPMVACIAFYASFVFGLLYLTLEVFPIVFQEARGWGPVVGSLPFLALFIGVLSAVVINLGNQPRYARALDASNGKPVPEARLAPMAIGSFIFAIGLWWFGWTAAPSTFWLSPVFAAVFIGAGFNIIFQQCINFLVDTYGLYAASAVSANTFLRSVFAAGLPLAAQPMFHNLGIGPAVSILAAVATVAIPVPFIFMKYGLKLRKMSHFAPVDED